ncbi:MAG: HIT domain-containing protein [Patescibacteria group bacterium]|nr:HIT domain-containing protein [Patescibacteria group bacterium]MDD4610913.1 HIT domain-containing protein [Patescibacteria group bacterium]
MSLNCKDIIDGKTEVEKIYESKTVLAFYHPQPQHEKHVVILSKKHINDLIGVAGEDEIIVWDMIKVAKYIAKTLDLENTGVRFYTDMGKTQECPWLYFYLISGDKINK